MSTLYHFTSVLHIRSILDEGCLRTTDPNLFRGEGPASYMDPATGEVFRTGAIQGQPVVWLLDVPTADGGHGLTVATAVDKRRVRITVEVPDARPWLRWIKARKHHADHVRGIILSGGGMSAARHWYVVARPIPRDEWTEVRDMRSGERLDLSTPD